MLKGFRKNITPFFSAQTSYNLCRRSGWIPYIFRTPDLRHCMTVLYINTRQDIGKFLPLYVYFRYMFLQIRKYRMLQTLKTEFFCKILTISLCPSLLASCNGVCQSSSSALGVSAYSTNIFTTSVLPFTAAA